MGFWITSLYWLHWGLDILFVIACLSVIFKPKLWARIYLTGFLAQQLILNGCLMTLIQNKVQSGAGWTTGHNEFIMAYIVKEPFVTMYKIIFLIVIIIQMYYIIKEIKKWLKTKKVA